MTEQHPSQVSFHNLDEVRKLLGEGLSQYKDVVYSSDSIDDAKKDRDKLKAIKKKLMEKEKEIESLLNANEIRVTDRNEKVIAKRLEQRRDYQQKAFTTIKLLAFLAQVFMEQQCILPKQFEQITRALYDCQNLLGVWVKRDNRRYAEEKSS